MRGMGRVFLIAMALVAGSPAWAQSASPQQPARRIIPLVRVRATLETTLDAKKAKPGEAVRARLEQDVPIPDGPTLPKNTILEGHVDQVQASEHHSSSSLVVTFDQAKLSSGETLAVKVTVLSIFEPATPGTAEESAGPTPNGPMGSAASTRPGNFPPAPGTMASPAVPEPQAVQTQSPPAQARGVPGVTLKTDVNLSTSATLLAERRNVHVPEGAEMDVAVGVIPNGVRLQ
jgi:hypothetical protein